MIYFDSDYMVGAHPEVMEALVATNNLHTPGYGYDRFTAEGRRLILKACGIENGEVYFLEGGTQTNAVVIDRLLDKNDGVIASEMAHINVHEAGAIESNGHKIITLPDHNGKLNPDELKSYFDRYYSDETNDFMVRPALVYITFPTELGSIYSLEELKAIRKICNHFNVPLYIDGARLAYGLAASKGDVTLRDIASLSDVFYIGGTKCGALFGEAVVTRRPELLPRFASLIKLHGATLAKGRLLGVQFATLFSNDLYNRIGCHAIDMAMRLKEGFIEKGYRLLTDSPTNQQFFILDNFIIDRLRQHVSFQLWGPRGESETAVRFVTDWATAPEDVEQLIDLL